MFVPAGTNAEIGAAAREDIEGRHGFDENTRVAVDYAGNESAEDGFAELRSPKN